MFKFTHTLLELLLSLFSFFFFDLFKSQWSKSSICLFIIIKQDLFSVFFFFLEQLSNKNLSVACQVSLLQQLEFLIGLSMRWITGLRTGVPGSSHWLRLIYVGCWVVIYASEAELLIPYEDVLLVIACQKWI